MKPPADLIDIQSIVDESQAIRQQAARVLRQAEELRTRFEHAHREMLKTMRISLGLSNGIVQNRHHRNQQP